MIERRIDARDYIIQVTSVGEATREEIDAHYAALRGMIAEMRANAKPVRVLSDQTRATRLSEGLNQHIRAQMEATYRQGDRVALLMATPDDQLYVRGVLGVASFAVFTSRLPAEMWLLERDLRPPSGA